MMHCSLKGGTWLTILLLFSTVATARLTGPHTHSDGDPTERRSTSHDRRLLGSGDTEIATTEESSTLTAKWNYLHDEIRELDIGCDVDINGFIVENCTLGLNNTYDCQGLDCDSVLIGVVVGVVAVMALGVAVCCIMQVAKTIIVLAVAAGVIALIAVLGVGLG